MLIQVNTKGQLEINAHLRGNKVNSLLKAELKESTTYTRSEYYKFFLLQIGTTAIQVLAS